MISKRALAILIVTMSLISIISICLTLFIKEDVPSLSETVVVSVDGVAEKTLTVDGLEIYPGEKRECIVFLKSELTGSFDATLTFEEFGNDNALKPYVDVKVFVSNAQVYEGALEELLSSGEINFSVNLDNTTAKQLKIQYLMDVNVGNDAQDATASFYVKLKINKFTV